MTIRHTIHYSGQVQGVGFRYTAAHVADTFPVTGYVQNLSDGRVLLVAEGTPDDLDRFEKALSQSMLGHITHTDLEVHSATGEFLRFTIKR